ncbi:MAG: hypothetical protein KDB14_32760 [Planctomycetales bacterium]|nr:hypothetical protein [Planctomycetales bacterium]
MSTIPLPHDDSPRRRSPVPGIPSRASASRAATAAAPAHGATYFRELLLAAHVLTSIAVLLATYLQMPPSVSDWRHLQAQLLYAVITGLMITRLRTLTHLLYPSGVFMVYTYLAYFVKSAMLFDQDLYFRNWITLNSPLAHATLEDWASAIWLAAWGIVFFAAGYWAVGRFTRPSPEVPATRRQDTGGAVLWLLAAGAFMVLLRVFVTRTLGMGASYQASEKLFLIPGLAGFLSLFSLWGGRIVLTAAMAMSITARSKAGVAIAFLESLAMGALSTISTGSKSELMLLFVVIAVCVFLLRRSMNRTTFLGASLATAVVVIAVVFVYPAFHYYRYVRNDVDIISYLQQSKSEMGLTRGARDVLRRLNGCGLLTLVVSYYEIGGQRPELCLNYQPFIVRDLFGVPDRAVMGIGLGPFAGMLLLGGWTLFPLLAVGAGAVMRTIEAFIHRALPGIELRVTLLANITVWLLVFMMFSGHFIFDAKTMLGMLCGTAFCALVIEFGNAVHAGQRGLATQPRRFA